MFGEVKYEVKTIPLPDGVIIQESYRLIGEAVELLNRWVMDTREEQIRQALISLGWTPPESEEEAFETEDINGGHNEFRKI